MPYYSTHTIHVKAGEVKAVRVYKQHKLFTP